MNDVQNGIDNEEQRPKEKNKVIHEINYIQRDFGPNCKNQ